MLAHIIKTKEIMSISRIFDVGQSVTTQPDERGLSDSMQPWVGSWHQTTRP